LSHVVRTLVQVVQAMESAIPNLCQKKHQNISVLKSNEAVENILLF